MTQTGYTRWEWSSSCMQHPFNSSTKTCEFRQLSRCTYTCMNVRVWYQVVKSCDSNCRPSKWNRESTFGCSVYIVQNIATSFKNYLSQEVEHLQVQNCTEPGIRVSEFSLLACYTRRKCSVETSLNSVKGQVWQS